MKRLFSVGLRRFSPGLVVVCLLAAPAFAAPAASVSVPRSIEAALSYNPELKASQEARQLSVHAVTRAKAGHLPGIGLSAGGGTSLRSDSNTRSRGEDDSFRSIADADLRLTQPLFHGFAISEGVERATAELASSDNLLEEKAIAITYAAVTAHTDVVRRTELVALAKTNVTEHAKILASVKNRYDTGVSTTGELNQVMSRHARAKATLATYESALDAARANYLRVTGLGARDLEKPASPVRRFDSLEDVRNAALLFNPGIQASLAQIEAAGHEKGEVESRFYPHFDFVTGPVWSDRESRADSHVTDFAAEVRLSWDFFSGGRDEATLRMSSAKIRQARQNLHGLMNSLNEDIESTFSRYLAAAVETEEYKNAKIASRNARQDYYRQFLEAQRSLIDVLDAESDFFYAASQEVMSRSDRLLSAYRLLALSGEILKEFGIDSARLRVESTLSDTRLVDDPALVLSPLTSGWDHKALTR